MQQEEKVKQVEVEVLTDRPTPEMMRAILGNGASPDSPKSTRWSDFEEEGLQPYTELWDYSKGLGDNYISIINKAVLLPNHDVQSRIAATYAALHSQLIKIAPMLAILGATGTGKSALTKVLSGFREMDGKNTMGSASTFAAIRNSVNQFRFKQFIDNQPIDGLDNEKPCMMVISDIKEHFFQGEDGLKKFDWARCRWDRSEEIQTISLGNGENLYFHTFSPCIVQSANFFLLKEKFAELYRRSLFIKTSHIDSFSPDEKLKWYNKSFEAIEPEMISWKGCMQEFINFWEGDNDANILHFQKLKRQHGNLKTQALQAGITEHQFRTNFYMMLTSRVLFDLKPSEVIDLYLSHFKFCKENIVPEAEGITRVIQMIVDDFTAPYLDQLKKWAEMGINPAHDPLAIKASEFKAKLDYYKQKQGVMIGASDTALKEAMHNLGFREEKIKGTFHWVWDK